MTAKVLTESRTTPDRIADVVMSGHGARIPKVCFILCLSIYVVSTADL